MSRLTFVLLLFLASYTAFAQPGLCPCWLLRDVRHYHPHLDNHPERPHSHGYLLELFNAETVAIAPSLPLPARTLILLLALGSLWWRIGYLAGSITPWTAPPPTPPPRLAASF